MSLTILKFLHFPVTLLLHFLDAELACQFQHTGHVCGEPRDLACDRRYIRQVYLLSNLQSWIQQAVLVIGTLMAELIFDINRVLSEQPEGILLTCQ